ncbi:unnamed protein product, partial [Symbiodinium pilosum]
MPAEGASIKNADVPAAAPAPIADGSKQINRSADSTAKPPKGGAAPPRHFTETAPASASDTLPPREEAMEGAATLSSKDHPATEASDKSDCSSHRGPAFWNPYLDSDSEIASSLSERGGDNGQQPAQPFFCRPGAEQAPARPPGTWRPPNASERGLEMLASAPAAPSRPP